MPTPTRYLKLTEKQNATLRELELSPVVNAKVRLRASIIRLNATGWNANQLAQHFNRNPQSIHNDLNRFEQHGINGLADGKSSGQPGKFTTDIEAFLKQLLEQNRVWNSSILAEEIKTKYGVRISSEAVRLKLLELGFSWKRTRYSPGKTPNPEVVAEHKAELEVLKRGHWTKR
jgi:transposase